MAAKKVIQKILFLFRHKFIHIVFDHGHGERMKYVDLRCFMYFSNKKFQQYISIPTLQWNNSRFKAEKANISYFKLARKQKGFRPSLFPYRS